jgi:hypothetical protein
MNIILYLYHSLHCLRMGLVRVVDLVVNRSPLPLSLSSPGSSGTSGISSKGGFSTGTNDTHTESKILLGASRISRIADFVKNAQIGDVRENNIKKEETEKKDKRLTS